MNKFLSLIFCLLLISCAEDSDSNLKNTDLIPDSAEVIFVSPSSEQLEKDLMEHGATLNSGELKDLMNEPKDLLKYINSERETILYIHGNSIGSKHTVLIIQKDSTACIAHIGGCVVFFGGQSFGIGLGIPFSRSFPFSAQTDYGLVTLLYRLTPITRM